MLMFNCMRKNKHTIKHKPFHLHLEYFFRKQYFIVAVLSLLSIAIIKSDGKMLGIMRDAYAQGYGLIGAYLREEVSRTPITVQIARIPTTASK
jgi:hypothetical protein